MIKSLWVFNALLGLVAAVLVGLVVQSVLDPRAPEGEPQAKAGERQAASATDADVAPPAPPAFPSLEEFASILQKDVFKNVLAEARVKPPIVQPAAPPPPPLPPLPSLVGTFFLGEERKAVLNDGKRTDIRGIGDAVAGGTLTKIEKDRVVIERAGTSAEVLLRASIQAVVRPAAQSAAGPVAATPGVPAAESPVDDETIEEVLNAVPAPAPAARPGLQPPQTTQDSTGNKAVLQQRWQERMQQLLERRQQGGR